MSTRSTTHFKYANNSKATAIIYRHSDGYPSGAGKDLLQFLADVSKLGDTRFDDPAYLAAKYVVYLADKFNRSYKKEGNAYTYVKNASKLDFLSVGVLNADPSDIEYRYVVVAGNTPSVRCYDTRMNNKEVNLRAELDSKVAGIDYIAED